MVDCLKDLLKDHIGHRVEIAQYGNEVNFALEDLDTDEVIFDTDIYALIAKDSDAIFAKVTNIQWDIDLDEALDKLDNMSPNEVTKIFGEETELMTKDEVIQHALSKWHHCPVELEEFMGLPDEVYVPIYIDEDEIADYLSDEYGFCINGFDL